MMEAIINIEPATPKPTTQPQPPIQRTLRALVVRTAVKGLIYISSYVVLSLILLLYLASRVYKALVGAFLLDKATCAVLPAADACWANEGPASPSNIIFKL